MNGQFNRILHGLDRDLGEVSRHTSINKQFNRGLMANPLVGYGITNLSFLKTVQPIDGRTIERQLFYWAASQVSSPKSDL